MTELKPCPFCGKDAFIGSNPRGGQMVFCRGCGSQAFTGQWNHRVSESTQQPVQKPKKCEPGQCDFQPGIPLMCCTKCEEFY